MAGDPQASNRQNIVKKPSNSGNIAYRNKYNRTRFSQAFI